MPLPPGPPSTPTRTLPYGRVDAGLVFERDAGSQGQRTQTLEPRVVYSYVPYRNQDELPIFDTGLPDSESDRTVPHQSVRGRGPHRRCQPSGARPDDPAVRSRLGRAVSVGDHRSDPLFLHSAGGAARQMPSLQSSGLKPLVTVPGVNPFALPGQALVNSRGQILMIAPGQYVSGLPFQTFAAAPVRIRRPTYPASDIVADVSVTAYKHFSLNLDYLWNPYTSQTDKSEVSLQYRPDPARVVNLGYRFQQNVLDQVILKQWDGSFAWPIAGHWNTVGRWVYSLQDQKTIEQMAGFEYKSCCYRIQVGAAPLHQQPQRRTGYLDCITIGTDGPEFGRKACGFVLGTRIRGYSTRDPNAQNPGPLTRMTSTHA